MKDVHPAVGYHDQLASQWKDKYQAGLFNQRALEIADRLATVANAGETWLDAGCGSGVLTIQMLEMGLEVCAVDASEEMIKEAKKTFEAAGDKLQLNVVDSIETMNFQDQQFDGILCSSVLEYVDNPKGCLDELHRVLKPGGHLVMTVPNNRSWIRVAQAIVFGATKLTGNPRPAYLQFSKNHYHQRSFSNLLCSSNFEPLEITYVGNRPTVFRSRFTGSLMLTIATKS